MHVQFLIFIELFVWILSLWIYSQRLRHIRVTPAKLWKENNDQFWADVWACFAKRVNICKSLLGFIIWMWEKKKADLSPHCFFFFFTCGVSSVLSGHDHLLWALVTKIHSPRAEEACNLAAEWRLLAAGPGIQRRLPLTRPTSASTTERDKWWSTRWRGSVYLWC